MRVLLHFHHGAALEQFRLEVKDFVVPQHRSCPAARRLPVPCTPAYYLYVPTSATAAAASLPALNQPNQPSSPLSLSLRFSALSRSAWDVAGRGRGYSAKLIGRGSVGFEDQGAEEALKRLGFVSFQKPAPVAHLG